MFQVTGKQILPIYLKVVESSYFNISDKVTKKIYFRFFFFKFVQAENRYLHSCLVTLMYYSFSFIVLGHDR